MKKLAKGFTLIELMIVVAIIGILAVIAIPNFRKYQLRAKFSEGTTNVEGLRKAEEALQQGERMLQSVDTADYVPGQYWNLGGAAMPAAGATPGTAKNAWTDAELNTANVADWTIEGATYFTYQVSVESCPGTPSGNQSGMCYSVGAVSDIDGDGTPGQVALVKKMLATNSTATVPFSISFPGTAADGSTCVDRAGTTVYGMPCVASKPDVF